MFNNSILRLHDSQLLLPAERSSVVETTLSANFISMQSSKLIIGRIDLQERVRKPSVFIYEYMQANDICARAIMWKIFTSVTWNHAQILSQNDPN